MASGALQTVAALYVERGGCYWDQPGVDPWDEARDARLYDGPWPVVAHPPCQRWGRYWGGAPTTWPRIWRETGVATPYIARAVKTGACQRLSRKQRAATPPAFRDLLLSIARTAAPATARAA